MYDPDIECKPDDKTVSVLGSDFALDESSDIKRLLKKYIYRILTRLICNIFKNGYLRKVFQENR